MQRDQTASLETAQDGETAILRLAGAWTIAQAGRLEPLLGKASRLHHRAVRIETGGILLLDTAGAWLILKLYRDLRTQGCTIEMEPLHPSQADILNAVGDLQEPCIPPPPREETLRHIVTALGEQTLKALEQTKKLISFLGETVSATARCMREPRRFRGASLLLHLERAGVDALPIIGLIAFLISVVLAYQGVFQLRQFGAEIFMVNLVTISVLREMGVLLTAIIVAGRSGSAFTSHIGMMQVNQEVDALQTIGIHPVEALVVPRVLALTIAMPLLTFYADMMGLFGGGVMAQVLLDMPLTQYMGRVQESIQAWTFWVGILKAPVFGFLIGMAACLRGLSVEGSAESVGRMTTAAVVEAIFLVLIADAAFSILFAQLGI